jgi:hypothetical protein
MLLRAIDELASPETHKTDGKGGKGGSGRLTSDAMIDTDI